MYSTTKHTKLIGGSLTKTCALVRCFSVQAQSNKLVLGCGSNVIDHIYNVKVVPTSGSKGFFLSPFKALEAKLIGGVTLNHLAWAALGGVSTGLLALQGRDELGEFLRANIEKLGMRTDFIQVDKSFSTSQCHVFIQEDGERSILMAPASTSCLDGEAVRKHFDNCIQEHASLVTTEISQVPLSGVKALLDVARKANILSVLDLDIPPSVAEQEAQLGSVAEVIECVQRADILKPAKAAAEDLLTIITGDSERVRNMSYLEMATELVQQCKSKLVALTNGSEPSVFATPHQVIEVSPCNVERVIDTTGAGDAFLGGLIVSISSSGLPTTEDELRNLGKMANAFGATCVQSVGGVPVASSLDTVRKLLSEINLPGPQLVPHESSKSPLSQFKESLNNDILASGSLSSGLDMACVEQVVQALDMCEGQLLISGVGKSGHVGRRFASSLGSIGLASHFIHATEFIHGDLGQAKAGRDLVLFLSHSGSTEECVRAAYHLGKKGVCTIAVTAGKESKLSKLCTFTMSYSKDCIQEPFDCLPSASLVVQEMLCNALLSQLIVKKGIKKEVFMKNHPGGSIGEQLLN